MFIMCYDCLMKLSSIVYYKYLMQCKGSLMHLLTIIMHYKRINSFGFIWDTNVKLNRCLKLEQKMNNGRDLQSGEAASIWRFPVGATPDRAERGVTSHHGCLEDVFVHVL